MEQKNTFKPLSFAKGTLASTIVGIVEAIILIAVGVVCIACSNQEWLTKGIFLAVGIIVTLFGAAKLALNVAPVFKARKLSEDDKILFKGYFSTDMIMTGSIELIAGILLIVLFATNPGILTSLMSFIGYGIAIALFVIGGTFILFATAFLVSKIYKVFAAVVYYILSAILIAVGILIMVFVSQGGAFETVVFIATGIILSLVGILFLVIAISDAVKARKEKKKAAENAPIETETVEVKVVEIEEKNEIAEK